MVALNPTMLWGLAAAAIPIIIHILSRRRHHVVDWGAMQFLLASHSTRRRRMRIEELLLLAVRTALLALLALAMARLFVRNPHFAGRGADRQDVAIVLDSSLSMSRVVDGETQFARAVTAAGELIDELSAGDTVTVLAASGAVRPLTDAPVHASDEQRTALRRRLADLEPTAASLDMIRSIDAAHQAVTAGTNPHRQIVIITDGQEHGWRLGEAKRWRFLADSAEQEQPRPQLRVLRLPAPGAPPANLAVTDITLDRRVIGTDRPVAVTVTVANTGGAVARPRSVELSLNGKHLSAEKLAGLKPGGARTLQFTHQFETPGSVVLGATLTDGDEIALDDAQHRAVEVSKALPVLLVDGAPSPDPLRSETAYLAAALQPIDRFTLQPVDYVVAAKAVEPLEAIREDFSAYRVVVLANVARVPAALYDKLAGYVEKGGGLLITPGDNVDRDHYNETLHDNGRGLLPARLQAPKGDEESRDAFERITETAADHPVMQLLAPPAIDLQKVRVDRWFPIEVPPTAADVRRIASLAGGDPLAVEKRVGRGAVICTAVPWDMDWSNLPACKAYVVLTHELVYHLAEPLLTRWNLAPSEPLTATFAAAEAPSVGQVIDPSGITHAVVGEPDGSRVTFNFTGTEQPGVYRLILSSDAGSTTHHFAVGLDSDESDLLPLPDDAVARLTEQLDMTFFSSTAEVQAALTVDSPGREIWRWLALAVLTLLLIEVLLTRAIANARHGEASQAVDYEPEPSQAIS